MGRSCLFGLLQRAVSYNSGINLAHKLRDTVLFLLSFGLLCLSILFPSISFSDEIESAVRSEEVTLIHIVKPEQVEEWAGRFLPGYIKNKMPPEDWIHYGGKLSRPSR